MLSLGLNFSADLRFVIALREYLLHFVELLRT